MLSQWLVPVDTIEVSVMRLKEQLIAEQIDVLEDAVTVYAMAYFSAPCLSTMRHLLTVGHLLADMGVPEYLNSMRELMVIEVRCDKPCCAVIHHSASNAN